MLDFSPLNQKEKKIADLVVGLTIDDLRDSTNEMVDTMLDLIADGTDADVVFQPEDPEAHDHFADDDADANLAWTLGHMIVHTTASAEESAFLAAEMARGVEPHGRSRYEVPWKTVKTIGECRARLEESRRMRLASLEMWPDTPHLEITYQPWRGAGDVNPVARFVLGLWHGDSHVGQIAEIMRQARAARA